MDTFSQYLYAFLCGTIVLSYIRRRYDPLNSIPTIGPSAPLLSYLGVYRYFRHAQDMLHEGYEKYKGSVFKVPRLDQWIVVVCGAKMNEELRRVPEDELSFLAASEELMQAKYTVAPLLADHPINVTVMRGQLTRNLATLIPGIVDEIQTTLQDLIRVEGDEWVHIDALQTMVKVVGRASNRIFVGLPLSRNPSYLEIVMNFYLDVVKGMTILSIVPKPLKPLVGPLFPWSRRATRRLSVLLKPVIEERQMMLREREGDWADKPNDMLMWLIEEAGAIDGSVELIVQGILHSNFASTHTSAISITHALYHLAAEPKYLQPLREEIESVIAEYGWSKLGIGKMWQLDSFMRESQRMNGASAISVIRKALKDVTFSDGTHIPPGTLVCAASTATHYDEENYVNANVFDPFRFSKMRGEESERVKHQYVSTSADYIAFGHGKHACPGRFFAAYELKAVLAHIILNYDVKFEGEATRPDNVWLGITIIPAPGAKVMFRKRQ
ncbi:hypothetical protein AcV5_005232 [Taiwanofungus camphoratus]|nr:hypothetical protein AcV5_005232 [Antrodia cinnamomea]